ncbi:MAG: hypothetical protein Ta2B_22220 [Termitinemataceae bacterium]|nr:MAG: hypothetical protein Ta2B_22220 [Termitinemataceae bacterium]
MNDNEIGQLTLIKGAIDGVYTVVYVARLLGISTRHVKRLKKAVRKYVISCALSVYLLLLRVKFAIIFCCTRAELQQFMGVQ